jgi:hypothetical protein
MMFKAFYLGEVSAFSQVSMASSSTTFFRYILLSRLTALWFLDSHMQATVVTADGTALTASESENADLFWAIRGGGSNFGVCTEFVLRLHPQRRTVFAGNVVFPAAVLDDLVKVLSEWWKNVKDHEGMLQIFSRDPAGNVSEGYLGDNSSEELTMPL